MLEGFGKGARGWESSVCGYVSSAKVNKCRENPLKASRCARATPAKFICGAPQHALIDLLRLPPATLTDSHRTAPSTAPCHDDGLLGDLAGHHINCTNGHAMLECSEVSGHPMACICSEDNGSETAIHTYHWDQI